MTGCVIDMMRDLAERIILTIEQAGGEAYIVGGAVRDLLLGRDPGDIDLATSLFPEEVSRLFENVIPTGIDHGTVTVVLEHHPFEVTTFRSESTYTDRRRPDTVSLGVSLEEDLMRRDFTINAMALKRDRLVDLFGGQDDLQRKLVRTVGDPYERFSEDALRMLRAFRFMSQLGFALESDTERAIVRLKESIDHVAMERIAIEMEKLMVGEGRIDALTALRRTGINEELAGLTDDVLLRLIDCKYAAKTKHEVWALFVHSGFEVSELRRWKRSNAQVLRAKKLAPLLDKESLSASERYALTDEELAALNEMTGRSHPSRDELPIRHRRELAVDGKDMKALGLMKEEIKEALAYVEEGVLHSRLKNERDILLKEVLLWKERRKN